MQSIREVERDLDISSPAPDPGFELSTVLVELKTDTARVLAAWLVNYTQDGLPGLPVEEIGEIRTACMDALGDAST